MKSKLILTLALAGISFTGYGQYQRCGTDAHQAALEAADPALRTGRLEQEARIQQLIAENPEYRVGSVVTIPVVFHIIWNTAAQNISDNRIYDQVNVLNADYSRNNLDAVNTRSQFLGVAANTQIQFCLAQRTPAGAATNGIVRVQTTSTSLPNNPNTISTEWDHTRYLNLYVGNLGGGLLGYANLPPGSTGSDHVVLLYSAVGGPNFPGTATPYHLGRTATHEVGHWLNLYHTFQSGCLGTNANNCASQGDLVCDTPPVGTSTFSCPTNNPNTCTETAPFPAPYTADMVDMYENYMDYTDDGCMNAFTSGQSTRMNTAITASRSLLITSLGCVPVGLEELLDVNAVKVLPNPSEGLFEIELNLAAKTKVNITVTDVNGKMVAVKSFDYPAASKTILDMTNESDGLYQMRIETQNGYLVKRLVKM